MGKFVRFLRQALLALRCTKQEGDALAATLQAESQAGDVRMGEALLRAAFASVAEVERVSGSLSEKGRCEAVMFSSAVMLGDPLLKRVTGYADLYDNLLVSLYTLVWRLKQDLDLIAFIGERLELYASEYECLFGQRDYVPWRVYSAFYQNPLQEELVPCLDVGKLRAFRGALLQMVFETQALLDKVLEGQSLK